MVANQSRNMNNFLSRMHQRIQLTDNNSLAGQQFDDETIEQISKLLSAQYPDSRVTHALHVAIKAHGKQTRKGSSLPYYYHLIEVALLLEAQGCNSTTITAGLLHDVLEDVSETVYSKANMIQDFGTDVTNLVVSLSEVKSHIQNGVNTTISWKNRKEAYIEHLKSVQIEALDICLADKISNLRSMIEDHHRDPTHFWSRFNNTNPQAHIWYYTSIESQIAQKRKSNQVLLKTLAVYIEQAKQEFLSLKET